MSEEDITLNLNAQNLTTHELSSDIKKEITQESSTDKNIMMIEMMKMNELIKRMMNEMQKMKNENDELKEKQKVIEKDVLFNNTKQKDELTKVAKSLKTLESKAVIKSAVGVVEEVKMVINTSTVEVLLDPFHIVFRLGSKEMTMEKLQKAYKNVKPFSEGDGLVFIKKMLEIRRTMIDDDLKATTGLKLLRLHMEGSAKAIVEYCNDFASALEKLFQVYFTKKTREEYLLEFARIVQGEEQKFTEFANEVLLRGSVIKNDNKERDEMVMKYFVIGKDHKRYQTYRDLVNLDEGKPLEKQIQLLAALDEELAKTNVKSKQKGSKESWSSSKEIKEKQEHDQRKYWKQNNSYS